uniref:hypothetical protein n=1 Tax=Bacillus thuringiensis TaxID=1428 RepID=UPI00202B33ED|nr:hypothetical protein [Bacillus thuringiensis]UQM91808.1 hypothetical protein SY271_000021 [Bacillus thuringiensis]
MANQQYEENRNSLDMFRFTAVICFTSGYLIAIIFKRIGALAQVGKLEKRIVLFWIAFGIFDYVCVEGFSDIKVLAKVVY